MIKNLKPTYEAKDEDEESYSYGCYDLVHVRFRQRIRKLQFIRCFVSVNLPNRTTLLFRLDDNDVSIDQENLKSVLWTRPRSLFERFRDENLGIMIVNAYAEEFKNLDLGIVRKRMFPSGRKI